MASASTTVHHEEIHLHIKKPGTPKDKYPQARCRNCTEQGRTGVDTRWIYGQCPQCPGLCSKACFDSYHRRQCFEILSAARRLQSDSAPEQPRSPEGQAHQSAVIEDVPPVIEEQLLSAEDWQRRLECEHTLATKPPTKRKKAPKLACLECRYKNGTRVDRRTICSSCQTVFCGYACLKEHHLRKGIFMPSSQDDQRGSIDQRTNDASQFDPNVPGTSSQEHHIAGRSYPLTSTPLYTSPLSTCTFEHSTTVMNISNIMATSWSSYS